MRLFFILLVFANLVFFTWTQGYLAAPDDGREPQRLTQQVHAEQLRIVRAAPPAAGNQMACRLIGGLNLADADALKAAIEASGGAARIAPLAEPPLYLIVITGIATPAAAERKVAELARLGVEGPRAVAVDGGDHEIQLGSHASEAAAREQLQGLAKRGIKSAQLDARQPPAEKARIEVRAPASVLPRLAQLLAPHADASVGECAP